MIVQPGGHEGQQGMAQARGSPRHGGRHLGELHYGQHIWGTASGHSHHSWVRTSALVDGPVCVPLTMMLVSTNANLFREGFIGALLLWCLYPIFLFFG